MSSEQFRTEFLNRLNDVVDVQTMERVISAFDIVSAGFDIKRAETALTIYGQIPELVKCYCAALAVEHKAFSTIRDYRQILTRVFTNVRKPLSDITTNDIRVFLFRYKENTGVRDSTVEHLRVVINAFFSWCVSEDYIQKNPAAKIKPISFTKNTRHAVTTLELERMRSACITKREKALLDFMFSTGCRVSEVAAAKLSDINWENRSMIVQHGKGDKQRVVYLNSECVVSLRAYLATRHDNSEFVFVSSRGAHSMSCKSFETEIRCIANRAGVYGVHPHILRHTMATVALRNGMPVEQVRQILGHESLDTTMIYAETDNRFVAMNHERFVS